MSAQRINTQINTFLENFEIEFDVESGSLSYGTLWGPKKTTKIGRSISYNNKTEQVEILDEGRVIKSLELDDVFKGGLSDELKGFKQFETLKTAVETKTNGQLQLKNYGKDSTLFTEPDALVGVSDDGSLVLTHTNKKPSIRVPVNSDFIFNPKDENVFDGFGDPTVKPGWIEDKELYEYAKDGVIVGFTGLAEVNFSIAYTTKRQRTAISFYLLVNGEIASPYWQNNYVRGLTNHCRSSQSACHSLRLEEGDLVQLGYYVFSGDTRQDDVGIEVDGKYNYFELKVGV
jgi:hypothetical protein